MNFEIKIIDGVKYLNIKKYYECLYFCVFNSSQELRGINKDFIKRERNGKTYKVFINQQGFMEWIDRKIYLENKSQKLYELKKAGFIDKNISFITETRATKFGNDLEIILNSLDITLKREVSVDGYLVDFVINDVYAVEYNENNHSSYDKSKEKERYDCLRQHFKKVIVITDSNNNLENISNVLRGIK